MQHLVDHPLPKVLEEAPDYDDPDVISFHEVVCDFARRLARHPEEGLGIDPEIAFHLRNLNASVDRIVTLAYLLKRDHVAHS